MNPIALLVLAVAPAARPAAPSCIETGLPEMRAAASRADSIALAERYLREPPGGDAACGRLAAAYLLGMTSNAGESDWQQRQQAGEPSQRERHDERQQLQHASAHARRRSSPRT